MAQFGEKIWFREIGEGGVSSLVSRMTPGFFVGHHDRTEQEQFCVLPRMELCEAKVGQDRHGVMHGMPRTGMACVALRGKWAT